MGTAAPVALHARGTTLPFLAKDLFGKLFGDRGSVSQKLFEQLYEQGLQLTVLKQKNELKCAIL